MGSATMVRGHLTRSKTRWFSPGPPIATSFHVTFSGGPNEEARAERIYAHRADDRSGDHRHPGGDRDPELHQVPGAGEAERGEGQPQGYFHCTEGVLPAEGPLLHADRWSGLRA